MRIQHIIVGCIAVVFIVLLYNSIFLIRQKQETKQTIADIPFCLPQAIDSTLFCHTQLDTDKPVVLMYMHPECEHCHTEAQQMQQKLDKNNSIQWVLVSYAERDSLNQFVTTYQLNAIPYLTVLTDPQFELFDLLQVNGRIPTCYIYDRRHRLVTVTRRMERLEKIIRLANK